MNCHLPALLLSIPSSARSSHTLRQGVFESNETFVETETEFSPFYGKMLRKQLVRLSRSVHIVHKRTHIIVSNLSAYSAKVAK